MHHTQQDVNCSDCMGTPRGMGRRSFGAASGFHFQQLDMTWVDFFKVETDRWHSRAQSLDDIRDFEKLYSSNVMIVMVVQFLATFYLRCFDCFKLVYSPSLWVRFGECLDCKAFGQRCRPGQSGVTVRREATICGNWHGSVDQLMPTILDVDCKKYWYVLRWPLFIIFPWEW